MVCTTKKKCTLGYCIVHKVGKLYSREIMYIIEALYYVL